MSKIMIYGTRGELLYRGEANPVFRDLLGPDARQAPPLSIRDFEFFGMRIVCIPSLPPDTGILISPEPPEQPVRRHRPTRYLISDEPWIHSESADRTEQGVEARRLYRALGSVFEARDRPYRGTGHEALGICIGSAIGCVMRLETSGVRGPLNRVLFEKRLARLGLEGDYDIECIKWLANE